MRMSSVRIQNFRGYQDSGYISFDSFVAFIGKNDAGKSSILDALNIFFEVQKIDLNDINAQCKQENNLETIVSVCFSQFPTTLDIDSGCLTSLTQEYLLNSRNELEIVKKYRNAASGKTFIRALHPTKRECANLHQKKNADLKAIVDRLGLDCDKTKNPNMRQAIWAHYSNELNLQEIEVGVDAKDSNVKSIWEKLQPYLPVFSLFRSDRVNDEKDEAVQDPLKHAIKEILKNENLRTRLDAIAKEVLDHITSVSDRTLEKLREMFPDVANTLHPKLAIPKWEDVFKGISISGDEDIPISKRGSGVRRLILLNFFRAEAERKQKDLGTPNVIYAIEEPETSQHANFQRNIIDALLNLSRTRSAQIIITTHSSIIVKALPIENIRVVVRNNNQSTIVHQHDDRVLPHLSLTEVSYLAFDEEATVEYHNELYGYLQYLASEENQNNSREKEFETWLVSHDLFQTKKWIRSNASTRPQYDVTLQTYVRNCIHHPENTLNEPYTQEEIVTSIREMRNLIKLLCPPPCTTKRMM